ncbi:MAG TPA: RNA 2',3'-cyclic phosphodiesterase [Gemmatimonadaceae bacterium]
MRLFLAINLPDDARAALDREARPLREAAPGLKWVAPERVHLTVRFLGEQPLERLAAIRGAVDEATARHGEVQLALGGLGAFPNFRRARVVWLGVAPDPRLELLHHDVEDACVRLGFEPEGRPFRPHVTLARVPQGAREEELRGLHRRVRSFHFEQVIEVPSVDLMVSELSPDGPRYRILHTSPLAAAV